MNCIIQGYFATDGSLVLTNNNGIEYPRLEIKSISKQPLELIRQHLLGMGIKGNIYSHKPENGAIIYRLQCNGRKNVLRFRDTIGFYNPKHEEKFKKIKN